ncbi:MAG TPA: hypothetical protein VGF99_14175, partial [Myxococcota bacterium]
VDGGDFLARGNSVEQLAYAAVIVSGPEKALKTTPMQVFEDVAADIKKRSNGAAVLDGVYITADDQPLRCQVLLSTLSLPKRASELVERAAREGAALAQKIAKDVVPVDASILDGLSLFRGTRGAGSLPPMPAQQSSSSSSSSSPSSAAAMSSTSLPPMPARAPVPNLEPSTSLPVTAARPAAPDVPREVTINRRPSTAATPSPLPATAALSLVDAAALSALPSLLDGGALLPPPNLDNSNIPGLSPALRGGTEEVTMEGETPPSTPAGIESLLMPGPQAEMEEAVVRYKGGDKKTKERIGRRWLEESRDPDVQVRLLAVMAMVTVRDGAFRRALTRCSNDDVVEIAKLAIAGLDALGDVPGVE